MKRTLLPCYKRKEKTCTNEMIVDGRKFSFVFFMFILILLMIVA